jgi:hypothetical protein
VLWVLIKIDLMALFSEFHMGNLLLYRLNFRTIILLPKCVEALMIQQYRPTYLLNVSFKIFMKEIIAHGMAQRVIQSTQSAFLPRSNIMEGVKILHETIHELHMRKKSGAILKIDFKRHMIKSSGRL